jgi:predicted transcriptional regulator
MVISHETLSVKMPIALSSRLAAAAQRRKVSKSAILREAVDHYLRQDGRNRAGSCFALARDLAGRVAGPGDLSFNKKHLAGYGR